MKNKKNIKSINELRTKENKKNRSINSSTIDLIPFKKIEKGLFLLRDSTYLDIYQIDGRALNSLSTSLQVQQTIDYEYFLNSFPEDFQLIFMTYPAETRIQRKNWGRKLKLAMYQLENEVNNSKKQSLIKKIKSIKEKITGFKNLEKELTNHEYYFVLFGKSINEVKENFYQARGKVNALEIEEISLEKKKNIIFRTYNKNTRI